MLIILRLFGRYPFYFEIICRTPKKFFMTLPNGRYKLWCKFAQIVFFIFSIFETPKNSVLEKIVSNKSKILTTKLILCRIAKISWFFLVPKNEDFLHCIGGIDFRKVSIYIFEKSKYFRIFTHFGEINLFSSMRRSVWACRFWILWNKWKKINFSYEFTANFIFEKTEETGGFRSFWSTSQFQKVNLSRHV